MALLRIFLNLVFLPLSFESKIKERNKHLSAFVDINFLSYKISFDLLASSESLRLKSNHIEYHI